VLQDVGLRAAEVEWLRRQELRDDPTFGFTSSFASMGGVSDSIGRSLLKTTGESRGDEVLPDARILLQNGCEQLMIGLALDHERSCHTTP